MIDSLDDLSSLLVDSIDRVTSDREVSDQVDGRVLHATLMNIARSIYSGELQFEKWTRQEGWRREPRLNASLLKLNSDSKSYDSALRRGLLYTNTTVLIRPGVIAGEKTSLGNFYLLEPGRSHGTIADGLGEMLDIKDFFRSLRPLRTLIASGRCITLPSIIAELEVSRMEDVSVEKYEPPRIQDEDGSEFLFPLNRGKVSDPRNLFLFQQFFLPYFPAASINVLNAMASSEGEPFRQFTLYLLNSLLALPNLTSAEAVAEIMQEIEYENDKTCLNRPQNRSESSARRPDCPFLCKFGQRSDVWKSYFGGGGWRRRLGNFAGCAKRV